MASIEEIREFARKLGVESYEGMDKATLIRAIQVKEGHQPCHGTDWCREDWAERCAWKEDCSAEKYFHE